MPATKLYAFLLLVISLLSLTGCWSMRETDEIAYVLAVGFDKGEKGNLVLTLSIANPRAATGNGGGEDTTRETVSVEAIGPLAMIDLLNTSIDRRIFLQHTKVFVFSEDLAREGLGKWLSALMRFREIRGNAEVFICRGTARDLIQKTSPFLELSPAKQYELIRKMSEIHGLYPTTELINLYRDTKSLSRQAVVPLAAVHEGEFESAKPGPEGGRGEYLAGEVPVAGKSKVQFIGSAVFRGDKLVGLLDGHDTRHFLMLTGKFGSAFMGITDPFDGSAMIGLRVGQGQEPEYRTSIDEDGNVVINVEIFLEPEIAASYSAHDFERTDLKSALERAFSEHVEEGCQELIKRTQDEFRSDIFGFGNKFKHNFLTVQAWEEYKWPEFYPEAQVNVNVHIHIRRTGLLMKTIPVVEE